MTQTVSLGDLINIRSGKSRPKETGGFPVYGGNGIFDSAPTANMNEPAVIVGRVGAYCGSAYIEKRPFWLSDNALGVTVKGGSDLSFIYYLLKSIDLNNKSVGGAQPLLTQGILNSISVAVPDLETQKKIADILSTIDEKIELNRKMNETLEQMGQARFRHYFIDNPEAEKWKMGQLDDLFEIVMGQSPPGSSYNENGEGITFYQGRAEFGVRFPNKRLSTVDPKRLAKKGDTLLSVRAPVGDINQATEDCCVGRGLAAVSSKTGTTSFCYYSCKNLQGKFVEYNSEGTVFGAINGKQLKSLKVKLPATNVIDTFEEQASKLDEQILNNSQQIKTLTTLRDTLLPRLISGKVRV